MLHYSNSIIDLRKLFGMQVSEINTINELNKRGFDTTLYTRKIIGVHEHIKEIEYHECDRILNDLPFYTRFFDENKDSDILQGNATPLLVVFRPEKTIIRINGHFNFPFSEQNEFQSYYKRAYYLFVSNYLRDVYLKKFPFLKKENCKVVHNAVYIRNDYPKEKNKNIKMLFGSRWIAQKGLFILIEVFKKLEKYRNDYELYIAGGIHTTGNKTPEKEKIENDIKNTLRNLKNVHIVGYLEPNIFLDFLEKIDVLIFPSIWGEPFSSMPLQAAIAKVPTIGFHDGSLSEAIENKKNGILLKKSRFNKINVIRLFNGLNDLLNNKDEILKMGIAARKKVATQFNWDLHIKSLKSIYKEIVGLGN